MSQEKVAAVFPGQGSQKPGMAQDFFEEFQEAKNIFKEAADASGMDLAEICFAEEDPRLNQTEFTQPCILTAEIAIYRVLEQEYNFSPNVFAGHSLGEYTALVAAGVIPFADAVKIVHRRGALMQKAVPENIGAMAAIMRPDLPETDYRGMISSAGAEIANINAPYQVVISGKKEAVLGARDLLEKAWAEDIAKDEFEEIGIRLLEVSAPFHSSLMKEMEAEFRSCLESFQSNFNLEQAGRVLSNYTADYHSPETLLDNLVNQISGSVRWVENMEIIGRDSTKIFEIGPNRPLGKFFRALELESTAIINLRTMKRAM